MQEIERGGTKRKKGGYGLAGRLRSLRESRARPPGAADYRTYRLSRREWLFYGAQGVAGCALAAYVFYRSAAAFAILLPLGLLYPLYKKKALQRRRARLFAAQFQEGILVLSSYLSAGYSLENSFARSLGELGRLYGEGAMIVEEFGRILAGIRVNRPVEALLLDFGERSGIEDVGHFAQVFAAARRSGGELVEIIGQTAGILRDKRQVQEEIETMTASRVFEQRIMNAMPFAIVLYVDLTSPGFFQTMYGTWIGRIVMTVCLAIYLGAVLLAKQMLEIEV